MVVVIGATGFIGVYTVDKLMQDGYDVIATGRNKIVGEYYKNKGVEFVELDMANEDDFKKLPTENIQGIILLGGLLPANADVDISKYENASDYIKINTIGIINVLEYCRKNSIKKVISTTSYADVFNSWKKDIALTEEEPRNFKCEGDHAVYVISKNAAVDIMEYYNMQHGLQCATFRLPPVYGVGPHSEIYVNGKYYKTGIQTFIEKAEKGEDIEIWGDPQISRDIIYVKDVATAFLKALQSDNARGLYNMTSGVPLTLEKQIETVIDVFSKEKKSNLIYRPDLKNNTPSYLFSMEKAKRDFGFEPEYTDYKNLMIDYKKELESHRLDFLINSRRKNK
ncbi:NAD(P)-dependent oxidoreductase [Clostridium botulinum]|uniref:NDP-sugar dehydratase or epimerase n=1 Tax=Clostridium botulinum (strain Eklund 17B / Type B) TaxID=935198 RepID=B2TQH0_CLOBB|nr:NDP-sugar dehydratase or epimerase [Clostridium botulinum B str. Eklund 17B (NRP)]MBN1046674.1 NAD(P)-dependent oxidoreductase [Clostridium botulinum]MBY6975606.1 NAD(P)-dependent oxidoreductase [Clostridium botulinum]MBY7001155.1 NAD(P)-dependent oxidoreductase [Clostridium botulinum]MCR1273921.1 NAD(P)-dependent oxidoreductase [Clostridium botulinum]